MGPLSTGPSRIIDKILELRRRNFCVLCWKVGKKKSFGSGYQFEQKRIFIFPGLFHWERIKWKPSCCSRINCREALMGLTSRDRVHRGRKSPRQLRPESGLICPSSPLGNQDGEPSFLSPCSRRPLGGSCPRRWVLC